MRLISSRILSDNRCKHAKQEGDTDEGENIGDYVCNKLKQSGISIMLKAQIDVIQRSSRTISKLPAHRIFLTANS